jgi:RNA-directed DNA polymerase
MLTALERGVKGGKWFSLIDKVFAPKNLRASWEKVRRNRGTAGVDHQTVQKFETAVDRHLGDLHVRLKEDRYVPQPALRRWIPKPGTQKMRPLGIPTIKDRVVQGAVRQVLEPLWEAKFVDQSYGFRPGRSCKDALRRVQNLLRAGYTWVVDADIQSYFDMIRHDRLLAEVEKVVADGRVLALLRKFLEQKVLDGLKTIEPEAGTPQGGVISPLLANIYLHPVDLALQERGFEMVRYADDLVILCKTEAEAQEALAFLRAQVAKLELTLHPEKTRLVDATVRPGFDFLGYHFERGMKWPRKKSLAALKDKVRELTRRTNGTSLLQIIAKLNPILKGWFNYFMHSHKTTFPAVDGWVRMRLRSILRRRTHRRGRGRGRDHQRWPNLFFRMNGLFALVDAHHVAVGPKKDH